MTFQYDESKVVKKGYTEENLVIATFDRGTGQWLDLESTVDTGKDTVTAKVSHFSTYTILARKRLASFTVTDLSITPPDVTLGESVTVSALVTNIGDLNGSYEVSCKIDGIVAQTREVTLDGADSEKVSFSLTPDTAGEYTISIGDCQGTCAVRSPEPRPVTEAAEAPASFTISDLSISPAEVKPAEQVTISAMVTNTGGSEGSYTVVLKINGAEYARNDVILKAGESDTVTFTVAADEQRSYTVGIDGRTGRFAVVVTMPPIPAPTEALPVQPPINWWLIGGIMAGCLLTSIIIWLRVKQRKGQ